MNFTYIVLTSFLPSVNLSEKSLSERILILNSSEYPINISNYEKHLFNDR